MVDFSYKRSVIDEMARSARSILILDHHKTAQSELCGYAPAPDTWDDWMEVCEPGEVVALFDMDRSGAGIAWDFFHDACRPPLIDHIEDRDLWRFNLPGTRAIQAALFSFPYDFDIWDGLIMDSTLPEELDRLRVEGEAIERKHFKDIAELLKVCQRRMVIGGIDVPVASLPYTLTSDAGHHMATADPTKIGVCYWDTERGRVFSLRSTDDGPDVSEIAKQYGGGGHAHAAGFEVPRDHWLASA
jgi:oligoribonuclease NrnB/cAMP/cGMP phosphodiesterase (DHH superfamily)